MKADEPAVSPWPPFTPDPAAPEWLVFPATKLDKFSDLFGEVRMRIEPDARVRCRFTPERRHRNIFDGVHGGYAMAIVDQVLFIAPHALGIRGALGGVTLDASVQFMAPLAIDRPLDAVVEILRETGRMLFMRGLIEQEGQVGVAFSGTIRKANLPR